MKDIKHPVIQSIIDELTPLIEERVERFIDSHNEQMKLNNLMFKEQVESNRKRTYKYGEKWYSEIFPLTERAIEEYRWSLKFDLIKAMSKYLLSTDRLLSICFQKGSYSGAYTADMTIERQGITHYLKTQVILAGGYNVQCLHIRYRVETELKSLDSKPYLTWLEKLDVYKQDLITLQGYISRAEGRIEERNKLTVEQHREKCQYTRFLNTENNKYTHYTVEEIEKKISADFKQEKNISWLKNDIKNLQNQIIKKTEMIQKLEEAVK